MNILVVEDDPKIREGLVELLESDGNRVDSAVNGQDGIDAVLKKEYDVVLTDLVMPIIGGMDVLKEVKKKSSNTRVIIITAYATIENAVEAIKSGASEYITKPFKVNEIKTKIRRVIAEAMFEESLQLIDAKTIKAMSNPIRRDVLTLLNKHEKLRFTNIKNTLQIKDATKLSFHLRILKKLNIIDQNQKKIYQLTLSGKGIVKLIKQKKY